MKDNSNKNIILLIIVILILFLAVAGIGLALFLQFENNVTPDTSQDSVSESELSSDLSEDSDSDDNSVALADNPIDFDALQSENKDLYAWITIPNTEVDYVVAQAGDDRDDLFYLTHNMYGDYEFAGTIYTEKQNSKDFSDPVTVLYGHKMLNGSMFAGLKNFENEIFFNEQRYFYIYLPGHILTYEIFSAYTYDDRHILNTFDFSDKNVFKEYLDYATDAVKNGGYVRDDVEVTTDDSIVVLSTCANGGNDRYLVQGVLTKDEETN